MSSEDAFGMLKNWSTAQICVSLKTIVESPQIRWDTKHFRIENIDQAAFTLAAVDSLERRIISLADTELTSLKGVRAITVKLKDGDHFVLEDESEAI